MGYRLEISKIQPCDCGGKLFGYIDNNTLHKCKSWKWLKDKGYLGKDNEDNWDYGVDHNIVIYDRKEFVQFIKLYIEDYNRYNVFGDSIELTNFKDSLEYSQDCWLLEWF